MKTTSSTSRSGFTLIEMLVVIAIIAILAGLLFPAINRALETAKRNQAASDVRSIAAAIHMFYNEYGYLPDRLDAQGFPPFSGPNWAPADEDDARFFTAEVAQRIIQVLIAEPRGVNTNHQLNPRRIVFLSMPNVNATTGELLDPWGEQYLIKLDRDLDGRIEFFSRPNQHRTRAVVVSTGRSRRLSGGTNNRDARDNVANVELTVF